MQLVWCCEKVSLDNAFVLIERHPAHALSQIPKWYASPVRFRQEEKLSLRHPPVR